MDVENLIRVLEMDLSLTLFNGYERRYLVGSVNGLKIKLFPNEHPPPHFHIESPDINASLTILTCDVCKGSVDSPTLKRIKEWHVKNKGKLIEAWNAKRPSNCPLGPIQL
jgi:hypothetical protein